MSPNIVILGSCKHEPYRILAPNRLDAKLYEEDHEKAYTEACKVFYPAIQKADLILVYGEPGKHTQQDIDYAISQDKKIIFINEIKEAQPTMEMANLILSRLGYPSKRVVIQPESEDFKKYIVYLRLVALGVSGEAEG